MHQKPLLLVVTAVVLVAGGVLIGRKSDATRAARPAAEVVATAEAARAPSALAGALAQAGREPATPVPPAAPAAEAAPDEPHPSGPAARFEGLKEEELPAFMAKSFAAEPTDATWSSETRSTVWGALHRHEGADFTVHDVECRSQTCRVSLSFADETARARTMKDVFMLGPEHDLNRFPLYAPPAEAGADGHLEAQVYLLRRDL